MEWKRRRFIPNLSRQFLTAPVIGIHLLIGHRQLAELHCTRGVSPMSTAYARGRSSLRNTVLGWASVCSLGHPKCPRWTPETWLRWHCRMGPAKLVKNAKGGRARKTRGGVSTLTSRRGAQESLSDFVKKFASYSGTWHFVLIFVVGVRYIGSARRLCLRAWSCTCPTGSGKAQVFCMLVGGPKGVIGRVLVARSCALFEVPRICLS